MKGKRRSKSIFGLVDAARLGRQLSEQNAERQRKVAASKRVLKSKYKLAAARDVHIAGLLAAKDLEPIDWQISNAPPGTFDFKETLEAGRSRVVRRYATSLDKYLGAWQHNETRGINIGQHGAGERFCQHYRLAARAHSIRTAALDRVSGGEKTLIDAMAQAWHETAKAMRFMQGGKGGRFATLVVERIAGWDETTGDCEKYYNWPAGHAIVRLREGLSDLVAFYVPGKAHQRRK